MNHCEDCGVEGGVIKDTTEGFYVCSECGVIQQDKIVTQSSEWTENGSISNDPESRTTTSAKGGKNSNRLNNTNAIATSDYYQIENKRMKKFFHKVCEKYNFSEIIAEKAFSIYKRVYNKTKFDGKKEIHRGRTLDGIKGACLYLSLNSQDNVINGCGNIKRTPREVSKMLGIDTKSINNGRKKITFDLGIETNTITHKDLIPIFIEKLNKNKNVKIPFYISQKVISFIEQKLEEGFFKNNVSKSISAGALYYILSNQTLLFSNGIIDDKIYQQATGVSLNTTLKIYKSIS